MPTAFFSATIVVEFPQSEDDAEAARDALNEYIVEHDISESFELTGVNPDELPYVVGVGALNLVLSRFATHDEASEFIGTLEGAEDGHYYLDGPERPQSEEEGRA